MAHKNSSYREVPPGVIPHLSPIATRIFREAGFSPRPCLYCGAVRAVASECTHTEWDHEHNMNMERRRLRRAV